MLRSNCGRVSTFVLCVFCLSIGPAFSASLFTRGDVDSDGRRTVSDAVSGLQFLFSQGEISCEDALDVDDSGTLNLSDPIFLLNYLFLGGVEPEFPLTNCSVDPTVDDLTCERFEACEPEIDFYEQQFTGDAFVFVVDRSGSMRDSGELGRAVREIDAFVAQLSENSEVAAIVFDANLRRFPSDGPPVRATKKNLAALGTWLAETPGGSGSCIRLGIEEGLRAARMSEAARKTIIYIGDGGGTCRGQNERQYLDATLEAADEGNTVGAQINTVGVLMGNQRILQEDILRELARRNGGVYVRIN